METTVLCRGYIGIMEKKMETTIGGLGLIVPLKYIEDGFGYLIARSPYTPYSIYFRGTIGLRVQGLGYPTP